MERGGGGLVRRIAENSDGKVPRPVRRTLDITHVRKERKVEARYSA